MKKQLFFIFCLFAAANTALAQSKPFTLGPMAGFTQSKLQTDKASYIANAKAGLQGGLFTRITIKKFVIQPEAFISLKRGEIEFNYTPTSGGNSLTGTQELSLTNLDIPLMLGYNLLDLKVVKLRAVAGPMASISLNNKIEVSTTGLRSDIPESEIVELKDNAKWAIQAGLGVDVLMFTLDVRYQLGLSDIAVNQDISNNLFHFALGYKFL